MVTSIPIESIPLLTTHQLNSLFFMNENEKQLINSLAGG